MSKYKKISVVYKDEQALIKALKEARVRFSGLQFESYANAEPLYGYHGKTDLKANYIIRRAHLSSISNDIGFERLPDGTFECHVGDVETGEWRGDGIENPVYSFVKQRYACNAAINAAVEDGYSYSETLLDNGDVELVLERAW